MSAFEMNRRQFLGSFTSFLAGLSTGGAVDLARAALSSTIQTSLTSLALPLLKRYEDFSQTSLALSGILGYATPGSIAYAGSADVFDFETCRFLYPLVRDNRFFFPEPSGFAELTRALFPTADPALAPAGRITSAHFIYTPYIHKDWEQLPVDLDYLRLYLKGEEPKKAPPDLTGIEPTPAQVEAWHNLAKRGFAFVRELEASAEYHRIAATRLTDDKESGSLWSDPSSIIFALKHAMGTLLQHREEALESFGTRPIFPEAQAWNYLRIFYQPEYAAMLARDPAFIARGRCVEAFYSFVRSSTGSCWSLPEMEEKERVFEETRAALSQHDIRFPERWEAELGKVRNRMAYKREVAEQNIERASNEHENETAGRRDPLSLLGECLPARWRPTDQQQRAISVEADFRIGEPDGLAATVKFAEEGWIFKCTNRRAS